MQPPRSLDTFSLMAGLLGLTLVLIVVERTQKRYARGELEEARKQRAHLENELEKRAQQLDGLLEKLHEAQNGDEQPS